MRFSLVPHPAGSAAPVEAIGVEVERAPGERLWLRYRAELDLGRLVLPDPAEPARADGLWRTTCFELFLREPGASPYGEFNFSPSRRWAAYAFEDVREGRRDLELPAAPAIACEVGTTHFALEATLALPPALQARPLQAAITAVIEQAGGAKSYWALAHPAGAPDFHDPTGFAAELPVAA